MLYRPLSPDLLTIDAAPSLLTRHAERTGYAGPPPAPTMEVLRALQAAHLAAIPFESFDPLMGQAVDTGAEAVDAKLLGARRRGGYCFEQNGLFLRVLRAAGFVAEPLLGRVRWMMPGDAPPTARTHLVLRVMLEGRAWLVDVGFGATVPPQPLAMDHSRPQPTRHERYRVRRGRRSYRVEAEVMGEWRVLYDVEDSPAPAIDLEVGNWYTSTHPASHFRHMLVAARTTDAARHGLRDNRLTIRHADGAVEQRYLDADAIERALADIFLIDVEPGWRRAIERAATAEAAPA